MAEKFCGEHSGHEARIRNVEKSHDRIMKMMIALMAATLLAIASPHINFDRTPTPAHAEVLIDSEG